MDLTPTLAANSDQVTADDLIGGPITVKITNISSTGNKKQPVSIQFQPGNGKAFLPCLTMRRVMAGIWGPDGKSYVGRSLRLFRDPEVTYGVDKVGGVRISHMSDISQPMTITVCEKRGKRTPYTVQPLSIEADPADPVEEARSALIAASQQGTPALTSAWNALPIPIKKQLTGPWWEDLKASTRAVVESKYEITGGVLTVGDPDAAA